MTEWFLQKGSDRRIRTKHPWVFSNELNRSPKGHLPGHPVVLKDFKGSFVAAGYGNPHSLISFRALSFEESDTHFYKIDTLVNKVVYSWKYRYKNGCRGSFRICYSEADDIPGLIVDLYDLKDAQVISFQILTAGVDYLIADKLDFFKQVVTLAKELGFSRFEWEQTAILSRNDVSIRKLEGLEVEKPQVLKDVVGVNLQDVVIQIQSQTDHSQFLQMNVDLVYGQKTGYFLDQSANIRQLIDLIRYNSFDKQPIRILDLCCYVGQWSAQLASFFKSQNIKSEFTLVDVSEKALADAKKNVEQNGLGSVISIETLNKDVVNELDTIANQSYDIVIADPPAFIKAKKDIPTGRHAYLKLNSHAFRIVKNNGIVVSCSCSGSLTEEDFKETILKSISRGQKRAKLVGHARHAVDHPLVLQFPEGFYLKMFIHRCY